MCSGRCARHDKRLRRALSRLSGYDRVTFFKPFILLDWLDSPLDDVIDDVIVTV